jgi:hypothetical protein
LKGGHQTNKSQEITDFSSFFFLLVLRSLISRKEKKEQGKEEKGWKELRSFTFRGTNFSMEEAEEERIGVFLVCKDSIASSLAADPKAKRRTIN